MGVRSIIFAILSLSIYSCGTTTEHASVKEYRISMVQGDPSFVPILKALVVDYNAQAGIQALTYVDSPDQANSRIIVTQGLEKRDGKVGWGQWLATTETSTGQFPNTSQSESTSYTMKVEFDADFLRKNGVITNGVIPYEAQKLFAHEVGHGFQMEHHLDVKNVMYYDITGTKDFAQYWPRVQAFFSAK